MIGDIVFFGGYRKRLAMNFRVIFFLWCCAFFIPISSVAEEKYRESYESSDYIDAIKKGALQRVFEMVYEDALNEIAYRINDRAAREKLIYRLSKEGIKKLDKILNPSDTDEEIKEKILNIINDSMLVYKSSPQGPLELTLRYSVDYLTTEISWKRKVETLECNEWMVTADCRIDAYGVRNCNTVGYYKKVYYSIEPDYYIYRIVDGSKNLVTSIRGGIRGRNVKYTISSDPKDWAKEIYDYMTGSGVSRSPELGIKFDYDADIREPNTTLSYRVEARSNRFWKSNSFCDSPSTWSSQSIADGNGDGYFDFIPQSAYRKNDFVMALPAFLLFLN